MKIFLSILTIFFATQLIGQNDSTLVCDRFKKGRYIMTGPSGGEIKIKRGKKIQHERYNREHQKYRFGISWTSSCEYVLSLKKVRGKKSAKEYVGSKVYVRIIMVNDDDYYIAETRTENGQISQIEITKIK